MTKTPEEKAAYQAAYYQAHRQKMIERRRGYREENRELLAVKQREYMRANPLTSEQKGRKKDLAAVYRARPLTAKQIEARRVSSRQTYLKYREERIAKCKAYIERNRERHRQWMRNYQERNPHVARVCKQNRRARLAQVLSDLTAADIAAINEAQRGRCAMCRARGKLQVDHIHPISKGGPNTKRNIQMLCGACNRQKHAKDPIDYAQGLGLLL